MKDGEGPYSSSWRFPDSIHYTTEDDFIIKLANAVHKRGYIVTPRETPQVFILYDHSSPHERTTNTSRHDPYQPTRNESQDKNRSRGASSYRS